jgi:integrase
LPADKRVKAPKALDTADAKTLLAYLRDSPDVDARWAALFTLLTTTGLRIGEAMALRWRDVDLSSGAVAVRATYTGKGAHGYPQVSVTKTGKVRTVVVPQGALGVLRAWREVQPDQRVQHRLWKMYATEAEADRVPEQECWPVFTVPTGEVVSVDWATDALTAICRAAGVKRMTPHGLRHSFATVALERGVHPKVVSDWLGHATTAQTMETYSHVMPAHAASESERVGAALFG